METSDFLDALRMVPESRPRILDLAREMADEDGRMTRRLTQEEEARLRDAEQEARAHARSTQRLSKNISRFMGHRDH